MPLLEVAMYLGHISKRQGRIVSLFNAFADRASLSGGFLPIYRIPLLEILNGRFPRTLFETCVAHEPRGTFIASDRRPPSELRCYLGTVGIVPENCSNVLHARTTRAPEAIVLRKTDFFLPCFLADLAVALRNALPVSLTILPARSFE